MMIWYSNLAESRRYAVEIQGDWVRIGRSLDNDVVLNSPFVAEHAAELSRGENGWELLTRGRNGCQVDSQQIGIGERCLLRPDATITLFPFTLTIEGGSPQVDVERQHRSQWDSQVSHLIRAMHLRLLEEMDLGPSSDQRHEDDTYLLMLERNIDEIARLCGVAKPENNALATHIAGQCVRGEVITRVLDRAQCENELVADRKHWSRCLSVVPQREEELSILVEQCCAEMQLTSESDLSQAMELVEREFWAVWDRLVLELFDDLRDYLALRDLRKQIKDIVFGYGPLEDLLRTPTIAEIMVVSRDRIYVERNGVVESSGRQFISDEVTVTIIDRIVSKVGRRIDKSQPLVDARLSDGSRVNAVIPPLALSGPCLTIRKFPLRRLRIHDLIQKKAITPTAARFLNAAVVKRKNILIAGGTGSGKTTLLNCLSEFIPDKERIVTIEDTAELQLKKEHVARLETKTANNEGQGAYSIHALVKNALRMRPDRIVVGECRGAEALDMLQAMNTGHDGSLTTIHANTAEDVILRLEVMVLSAANLPISSIHRQIASAIDLVVQLQRMRDGSRRVTQITEFVGCDERDGSVCTREIFRLESNAKDCELRPTGSLPTFMSELVDAGLLDLETFYG